MERAVKVATIAGAVVSAIALLYSIFGYSTAMAQTERQATSIGDCPIAIARGQVSQVTINCAKQNLGQSAAETNDIYTGSAGSTPQSGYVLRIENGKICGGRMGEIGADLECAE